MLSTLRRGPVLWILAAITLLAVGGAAFTAANTTPLSSAGSDVAGVVSGFTISGITYTLNTTDPTLVDSVVYTAQSNHAGPWPASLTTLVGRFTTVPAAWYVCTDAAGGAAAGTYVVTCASTGVGFFYDGATAETQLTVLAAVEFDTVLVQ